MIDNRPARASRFRHDDLFDDRVVCLMRATHPLARRGTMTAAEFADAPQLCPTPSWLEASGAIDRQLERVGLQRRIVVTLPHFELAAHALVRTDMLLTTTYRLARHYAKLLPLAAVALPAEPPDIVYRMTWNESGECVEGVRWLRGLIAEATRAWLDAEAMQPAVAAVAAGAVVDVDARNSTPVSADTPNPRAARAGRRRIAMHRTLGVSPCGTHPPPRDEVALTGVIRKPERSAQSRQVRPVLFTRSAPNRQNDASNLGGWRSASRTPAVAPYRGKPHEEDTRCAGRSGRAAREYRRIRRYARQRDAHPGAANADRQREAVRQRASGDAPASRARPGKAHCTDAGQLARAERKVADKQRDLQRAQDDVHESQARVHEAEALGNAKQLNKAQRKLADKQIKLRNATRDLHDAQIDRDALKG